MTTNPPKWSRSGTPAGRLSGDRAGRLGAPVGKRGQRQVADSEAAMARLKAAGVVASLRAGRIRLSAHFYNLDEEIDRAAEILAGA